MDWSFNIALGNWGKPISCVPVRREVDDCCRSPEAHDMITSEKIFPEEKIQTQVGTFSVLQIMQSLSFVLALWLCTLMLKIFLCTCGSRYRVGGGYIRVKISHPKLFFESACNK